MLKNQKERRTETQDLFLRLTIAIIIFALLAGYGPTPEELATKEIFNLAADFIAFFE